MQGEARLPSSKLQGVIGHSKDGRNLIHPLERRNPRLVNG